MSDPSASTWPRPEELDELLEPVAGSYAGPSINDFVEELATYLKGEVHGVTVAGPVMSYILNVPVSEVIYKVARVEIKVEVIGRHPQGVEFMVSCRYAGLASFDLRN